MDELKEISKPARMTWSGTISHSDMQKLIGGLGMRTMDDRWIIRTDGPDEEGMFIINIARSWTRFTLVAIKAQGELSATGPVQVKEALYETNRDRWRPRRGSTQESDAKEVARNVCRTHLAVTLPE